MMQHVIQDKSDETKKVTTIEIQQDQTPLSDSEPSVETHQGLLSKESNFGPDMSGSEDDEASEVDSFFLEEAELKEGEYVPEQSKYLLPAESIDTQPLRTVDPETHARLEALLEAAGISKLSSKDGKALTDPEVLRTLTSSVSSALDEAAQALHRMRAEQQSHLSSNECARSLADACGEDVNIRKLCDSTNVPEPTEEGESLLSLACSAGYYELAQVLLAMKANVEDRGIKGDCTPLMEAASGGHVDIVRLLISHGADVDAQSSAGNTPLHYAACGGFTEVVQEIIKANARVEVHNENGHTPLMEAASAGHVEVARILLDNGAGINTHSNEFKESALTLACYKGHLEMVKFLLEAGADQEHKTDEMHTALMEASMDGHVEVARLLLDSGAQVNMPADSFESPLTLAACGGHVDLASLLIERGANIEEVNDEGYTPLMEAAREGHDEMVVLLLSHNAYINGQTEETQETALTLACCGGFLEVADFLIQAGADIELGCSTPLMEAAQEGHLELVNYLLKSKAKVHAQTGTGDTALTYACENGHTDVAEILLEHGADLEHESEGGRTPLMKAARAGHLCTVQFLIRKGADVNRATTTNDHTVLSLACAGGHLAVVELLLAHASDSSHKLKDGSTMVIEAAKGGHTPVVKLLLEWPNHHLVNSPEHVQLSANETTADEPRVPVQGLANIVPPSEPDSQLPKTNFTPNFSGKNPEQVRQNIQKSLAKRCLSGQGEGKLAKLTNTLIAEGLPSHDGSFLAELGDEKATEKVEAIINNIMAKELINTTTASKEEQILRKQQILEELQKVERELQEKAQAQLLLSAQQQLEQHQQQLLAQTAAAKAKNVSQGKCQTDEGKKKVDSSSSQLQNLLDFEVAPGLQITNDLTSQLPKELTAITQSLLPHYTEAFLRQNNMLNQNNGAMSAVQERTVPTGSQPQDVMQSTVTSQMTVELAQRQQLQVLAQPHLSPLAPYHMPLTTQQQEQLIQHMLSQQAHQQQLLTSQQFSQSLSQQALQLHTLPQQQQQALQVQAQQLLSQQQQQQLLSQQQQQQLLQQQQQAQHLQQQLNKLKQPANSNNKQPRKLRPNQNPADEVVTPPNALAPTSPPPSTPVTPNPSPASPQSSTPLYSSVDVDAETESNHDTALTLACAGGHTELVSLLLSKGSDIEHRDKKGFTPLILAATAGHVDVVEILLDNTADIEAQSERTKDTPLSLACSGGRYEVVELLLAKGANKEHRNVSDYTPLSLAASGGYVNIIKLLLSHGAEINSRTGSKLGISPLMLAAMNGHTAAVKLLLDMGSDINAQIETNRNTALTLACFQGRHEVVSLLVDRKANIEHRAKTGLTPLMEAASGGYVEVGRVLLERGADVNAPPVPSSRDTALTIAADKGHYRFVELLLNRGASVDVKNKKGNSPLWLACNGGHLDVVQLLVSAGADIDSQDNRKVSCLMAAFRKGHVKVVKWMVKHVSQFPSDTELQRYIATVNDKELQKKCQQCMETIVTAKDRQAAEANKNATILLEEIDKERQVEENRKAQAAKKRERRKRKRKEKLEKEKETSSKNSSPEPESAEVVEYNEVEELIREELPPPPPIIEIKTDIIPTNQEPKPPRNKPNKNVSSAVSSNSLESKKNRKNRSRDQDRDTPPSDIGSPRVPVIVCNVTTVVTPVITTSTVTVVVSPTFHGHSNHHRERNRERNENRKKKNDFLLKPVSTTAIGDLDEFGTIPDNMKMSEKEIQKLTKSVEKKKMNNVQHPSALSSTEKVSVVETSPNTLSLKGSAVVASPKRGAKKEEGWKEVVRKHSVSTPRSKRVLVPSGAISRVIGRGGCNINAIREVSGAHVEVEKPKGSGDRTITIKGSAESTKQAQALIMALVQEPDKELTEIIARGKAKPPEKAPSVVTIGDFAIGTFSVTSPGSNDPVPSQVYSQSGSSNKSSKNSGSSRASGSSQVSNSAKSSGANGISHSMIWQNPHPSQAAPSSPRRSPQKQLASSNQGQTGSPVPGICEKNVPRQLFPDRRNSTSPVATFTNTTVSYSSSSTTMKIISTSATLTTGRGVSQSSAKQTKNSVPGSIKVLQRPQTAAAKSDPQPLPIVTNHVNSMNTINQLTSPSVSTPGDYSPFKNFFNSTYILSKKEESTDKMNFASVAAAGVVSTLATSHTVTTVAGALSTIENKIDPALQAKAPGYKPGRTASPQFRQDQESGKAGFRNFQLPLQNETDMACTPGYRGSIPGMSPRSNPSTPSGLSPRSQTMTPLDLSQHSLSLSSASSQKDEYSMPNQPMTLPEIKSTLNPNAPDFQLAASNMGPMINGVPVGMPLNFPPSQSLSGLPPAALQALQQQLFNAQQQLMNPSNFNSIPPQPGNFIPPTGMNQSETNFNMMQQMASQLSQQMAAQGMQGPSVGPIQSPGQSPNPNSVPGFPQMMSRNLSPMPPHPRPNSAPSMSVMQADGPGPIGPPPKAPSPMPPCTPPLNDSKSIIDDRRVPRPIGGERSQRKAPGPPAANIATVREYNKMWVLNAEMNSEWTPTTSPLMSSAPIQASVITSSVITGGNMAYDVNSAQDVDCPPTDNPNGNSFSDSLPVDPTTEQNFQNAPVMIPMFPNGVPGHYPVPPMFNPRVGGDNIPSMWNSSMKQPPPTETVEAGNTWAWSKQADI
ncbi:ankyrin repeat and KH domain-containing protein 1-like [Gigantopelta aegis]|uniref:ankyrin repeat and KH domain-containing protein 1-like n=1 Tax=Gigantopelta aegis TaxID=1735272 RepID=UPI001B88DD6B|nr:ankyrin repeat and KH domain-containing protein 1-like [Gigantopelta aegis]